MIEVAGQPVTTHDAKTAALTEHFVQTMGAAGEANWDFAMEPFYAAHKRVEARSLVEPFSSAEALVAVRGMNSNSAPGPDGFGPSFYKAAWPTVQDRVMAFLEAFHNQTVDLERINRSYIVLIPKTPDAVTVTAFRPICLQNCDIKIASKILTSRLQRELHELIDLDQTGFLRGRSISETFIYAMELTQCCYKRKAQTLVLKLDFAKAFDTVIWSSLQKIMLARGFPEKWCAWIHCMLSTSKSAVLVNGTPGPWFTCRKGLRQGDPLSPYLFLLVADVLQRMIQHDRGIRHPLAADHPCPVLQYADDTLILVKAELSSVQRLKNVLDSFAAATGLKINFHKSTVVPMHVEADILQQCHAVLGCREEQFPQSYLGLPLSHEKLRLSSFVPMISRADKYLARWKAALLNTMGRAVLADSVLGSFLIYAMGALELPKGTLKALEGKRRTFVWTGAEQASGAKCLVAWEQVCLPKESGGLGLKNLSVQNQCMLLKLIHRLHHPEASSWARWARQRINLATLTGDVHGAHWDSLRELLPLYRSITTVEIKDGTSTSFWDDSWLPEGPLSELLPALHSHATSPHATVSGILSSGIDHHIQRCQTRAAVQEKAQLSALIAHTHLTDGGDMRNFQGTEGKFQTSLLYKALMAATAPPSDFAKMVWNNCAPPRVKFFIWLLVQNRIQSRSNLLKKSIITDATCALCHNCDESADHLIFTCPVAASLWQHVGIERNSSTTVSNLGALQRPNAIPETHFSVFIFLCCWNIWKHRNRVVFDAAEPSLQSLLRNCQEEARVCAWRMPRTDTAIVEIWCSRLSPM